MAFKGLPFPEACFLAYGPWS